MDKQISDILFVFEIILIAQIDADIDVMTSVVYDNLSQASMNVLLVIWLCLRECDLVLPQSRGVSINWY